MWFVACTSCLQLARSSVTHVPVARQVLFSPIRHCSPHSSDSSMCPVVADPRVAYFDEHDPDPLDYVELEQRRKAAEEARAKA